MAKKRIEQCRSGHDFVKFARKRGAEVQNGKGSHAKVRTGNGMAIVPRHNKDLANGTRASIIKTFAALGLAILLLSCRWLQVLGPEAFGLALP